MPEAATDRFLEQLIGGRYLIKQKLGQGGVGAVYLAQDLKILNRQVVVKILLEHLAEDEYVRRKFQHEIEALTRLDHPGIVHILDAGLLGEQKPYLVMPYVPGRTLREAMNERGQLELKLSVQIVESLTAALAFAHEAGVIHRDVKPENVMLTECEDGSCRVRLIDFGLVRVFNSQLSPVTQMARGAGTVWYVAPEQIRGEPVQTAAADIYSCGAVFFEMLTAAKPFNPNSIYEIYKLQQDGVQNKPSDLRPELSPAVDRLILQSLSFEPPARPASAAAFGKDLAQALQLSESAAPNNFSAGEESARDEIQLPPDFSDTLPATESERKAQQILSEINSAGRAAKTDDSPRPRKMILPIALAATLLLTVCGTLIFFVFQPTEKADPAVEDETPVSRETPDNLSRPLLTDAKTNFSFYLQVQEMRGGKPFGEPSASSGQERLRAGDKFKVVLEPQTAGRMYLFYEGENAAGETIYKILFPTPRRNGGQAQVDGNRQIETGDNTLGGGMETDSVWIVWTREGRSVLERARADAFQSDMGEITNAELRRSLKDLLRSAPAQPREIIKDAASKKTIVGGSGDSLIYRLSVRYK